MLNLSTFKEIFSRPSSLYSDLEYLNISHSRFPLGVQLDYSGDLNLVYLRGYSLETAMQLGRLLDKIQPGFLQNTDANNSGNLTIWKSNKQDNLFILQLVKIIIEKALERKDGFRVWESDLLANQIYLKGVIKKIDAYISKKEAIEENEAFTKGATAGALKGLPPEISFEVAKLLTLKEGGRLAQTSKLAFITAKGEQKKLKFGSIIKELLNEIQTLDNDNAIQLINAANIKLEEAIKILGQLNYTPATKTYAKVVTLASLIGGRDNAASHSIWTQLKCSTEDERKAMGEEGEKISKDFCLTLETSKGPRN